MRIADRLARLERIEGEHPRLSRAEIEAAATRYEAALRDDGVPGGGSVQQALDGWRRIVEGSPPWAQRVYLNAEPADMFA